MKQPFLAIISIVSFFVLTSVVFADDPNREPKKIYDEILNQSNYEVEKYNFPSGSRELNLFGLEKIGQYNLNAVASPDFQYLVYSEVYFLPAQKLTTSGIYLIELDDNMGQTEALMSVSTKNKRQIPLIETNLNTLTPHKFNTFTVVDWNKTSDKILIKEYIGENFKSMYGTKLYIYDFSKEKLISLNTLRKSIIQYYIENKNIYLEDFNWKIIPLGFKQDDEDIVVAEVYSYRDKSPVFLGVWAIKADGTSPEIVSEQKQDIKISANGFSLKFNKNYENLIKEQKEIDSKKTPYLVPPR